MHFTENFAEALQDYIFLLEKKYPEKTILEMVATRYSLNHFERSVLFRGIARQEIADRRKNKLITIEQLNNRTLHIDLFNVLFTLAAYLRGFPVYQANDGLTRDASESHDSSGWLEHLQKSLDLLLEDIDRLGVSKIIFYLDSPLHLSGMMARDIEEKSGMIKTKIEIIRDDSPDHLIRQAGEGVLATSDSTIIDRSSLPVFDLPSAVLYHHFEPTIMDALRAR